MSASGGGFGGATDDERQGVGSSYVDSAPGRRQPKPARFRSSAGDKPDISKLPNPLTFEKVVAVWGSAATAGTEPRRMSLHQTVLNEAAQPGGRRLWGSCTARSVDAGARPLTDRTSSVRFPRFRKRFATPLRMVGTAKFDRGTTTDAGRRRGDVMYVHAGRHASCC